MRANSIALNTALCRTIKSPEYVMSPTSTGWNIPGVRRAIEKYVIDENFKTSPELGRGFVHEMDRLIKSSSSEDEVYSGLRDYFERINGLKAIFSSDRKSRLNRRSAQVKELLEGRQVASLLDVGCGSGEITNELMQSIGLEPQNVNGLEVVVKEDLASPYPFEIVSFGGSDFPPLDQSFDLVTVFSVLHHAEDPIHLIREVKSVQSDDGYIVIRDCDAKTYELQLFNLIADYLWYKVYTPCDDVPMTGNYLPASRWAQLFEEEGLTVEKITYPEPNNPYKPFMMLLSKQS